MSNIYLDIDVLGGTHIHDAIREMVALAGRLQIDIWANLNGIRLCARPGDDPELCVAAWEQGKEGDYTSAERAK